MIQIDTYLHYLVYIYIYIYLYIYIYIYLFIYLGNSADNAREKSDLSVEEIGFLYVNLIYKKKICIKGKNKKKVY